MLTQLDSQLDYTARLREAYLKWQGLFPAKRWVEKRMLEIIDMNNRQKTIIEPGHYDGDCCTFGHFIKENGNMIIVSDERVCPREKAWRAYIRIRDSH